MKKRTLLERLFWSPNFFTIAVRKRTAGEAPIWERKSFRPDHIVQISRRYWVADPVLAEDHGKTYLFYEAVHRDKGQIEVVQLREDGTFSQPVVAVEREYHLSYPFVFQRCGVWYMIPESCAVNRVQLLKATHFPDRWEYVTTLLDAHAVDTTVQEMDGKMLLLTFVPQTGSERVVPRAYWMNWQGETDISMEEISWADYDPLQVRGAGRMILRGGRYMRPAQVSQETSYGDAVCFFESDIADLMYQERKIAYLTADDLHAYRWKIDGLHTYAATEQFEVIDMRCQLPDPGKVLRKMAGLCRR